MSNLEFEDEDGTLISFHVKKQYKTISVGITDSAGRSTNQIDIPFDEAKQLLQTVLINIHDVEEDEWKVNFVLSLKNTDVEEDEYKANYAKRNKSKS